MVHALLQHKRNGYFIDLAANHPVAISNTRALERDFGWNGLCVEANPYYHEAHVRTRRCRLVACAVSDIAGKASFAFQGGSGAKDPAFGGLVGGSTDNKPGAKGVSSSTHTVQAVRFDTVLQQTAAPSHIDFLSLDVEGAESLVMRSFPWHSHSFAVLVVERPKSELVHKLRTHKYGLACKGALDEFWVHRPSLPHVQTVDLKSNGTSARPLCDLLFEPVGPGGPAGGLRMVTGITGKRSSAR